MLRTVFVLLIVAAFLPFALTSPFYALLFYLWLSYFRPEQWVWSGSFVSLHLQIVVGGWVVLFTVLSRERLRFGWGPLLLLLFLVQCLLSAWSSPAHVWAWASWQDFAKIALICYLMLVLVTTEQRLRLAIGAIALSLGFEGAKQGWAQLILNPGAANENWWPLLGDNNGVAIGMLMLLSLLAGLIRASSTKFERYLGQFLAVGVAYRAISTYSRGGFLALGALVLHFLLFSRRKIANLIAVGVVAAIILPVLPTSFWDRMGTIRTAVDTEGRSDRSSSARLHFWGVAVAMANQNPLFGVGLNSFSLVYNGYDSTNGAHGRRRSVHSMWFGLLAEVGYPGLLLFVVVLGRGFLICRRTRRLAKADPQLAKLAVYATAIEGALIVAVIGGTFFHCQYNEMLWHTIALTMVIESLANERATQRQDLSAAAVVQEPSVAARRRSG